MATPSLLQPTDRGLYCEAGDFYIDPWQPVPRAVITHAHADHARWGCDSYLTTDVGAGVLAARVQPEASIQTLPYGEPLKINGVTVSLHPAGHILGSAQVRVEHHGEIWVVSGDYKTEYDATSGAFEPVRCHTFVTESTFGLPVYKWQPQADVFAEINQWWRGNIERGWTSVLMGYALGKAQRLMAGLDPSIGPILVHGAVARFLPIYAAAGIALPEAQYANAETIKSGKGKAIVIAPPSAANTPWLRKFGPVSGAFASGWMAIRGARRRRAVDRGFVVSDHADWNGVLATIRATGAENIAVTHGFTDVMVRYLREQGLNSWIIPTHYEAEPEEVSEGTEPVETDSEL